MPYSPALADRIRFALREERNVSEKKMFGGLCFLLNGNMLGGIQQDALLLRLTPEEGERAVQEPFVTQFENGGRKVRGWVWVAAEGIDTDRQLRSWLDRAKAFISTLPAK